MGMVKRGYTNGVKIIEFIEGNLDVVLYNEKETSFYFYRYNPEEILGKKFASNATIVDQKRVREVLESCGKTDYDGFINELIMKAVQEKKTMRDEM